MPALDLDWTAIRASCMIHGIVATAERMGITQHLDALYQRSKREGWLRDIPRSQPMPKSVLTPVSTVRSAADAIAANMREDAVRGRAAALRAGRRALEKVALMKDKSLVTSEIADLANKWGRTHALAAGYGAGDGIQRLDLRVTTDRRACETIAAEVIEIGPIVESDEFAP